MNSFEHALDDRAEPFSKMGNVARAVAENHCDILVDHTTHIRWLQLMGLLREVDTMTDDSHVDNEEILQRLRDFTEFEERYPALTDDTLGAEARELMLKRTDRILRLGQYASRATSIPRFIALRIVEGREVATLLQDTATHFVSMQPQFNDDFIPTMKSMAITANLVDSVIDAKMDYRDGNLAHEPNIEFLKAVSSQVKPYGQLAGFAFIRPSVLKAFVGMGLSRVVNRVKQGRSDTSSLRVLRRK